MNSSKITLDDIISSQITGFAADATLEVKEISAATHALIREKGPTAAAMVVEGIIRDELRSLEWPPRLGATLIRAVLNGIEAPGFSFLDAACIYLAFFHELDGAISHCRSVMEHNRSDHGREAAVLLRHALDSLRQRKPVA